MERDGEAAKADVPFENQVGGMCEPPDEEPAAEEDESDKPGKDAWENVEYKI